MTNYTIPLISHAGISPAAAGVLGIIIILVLFRVSSRLYGFVKSRHNIKHVIALFIIFTMCFPSFATTYYVDSLAGNNSNSGLTKTNAWKTITYALTQVASGDAIGVTGTYNKGGGEDFPLTISESLWFKGSAATIEGIAEAGTTLEAIILVRASGGVTIEGFSIVGKDGGTIEKGIRILSTRETIEAVYISENMIDGGGNLGQGIGIDVSKGSSVLINNNIIIDCEFGMFINGSATAENNTVYNCSKGGIIAGDDITITLRNNIVADSDLGFGVGPGYTSGLIAIYNDSYANNTNFGSRISADATNIEVDPLFIDPDNEDFRLQSITGGYSSDSPCIDAGDPASAYDNESTPNGNRINMGAYGNTGSAARTTTIDTPRIQSKTIISSPSVWRPLSGAPITIAYDLDNDADTTLFIYSMGGEIVFTSKYASGANGGKSGYNAVVWNGTVGGGGIVGNGVYIIKLVSDGRQIAKGHLMVLD